MADARETLPLFVKATKATLESISLHSKPQDGVRRFPQIIRDVPAALDKASAQLAQGSSSAVNMQPLVATALRKGTLVEETSTALQRALRHYDAMRRAWGVLPPTAHPSSPPP
mgnify:CR=1 FL=1